MDGTDKTNKRLLVYDRHDNKNWISLDVSSAELWELEAHGSDWDAIDAFYHRNHERTLYRLLDKRWVLVERTIHFIGGEEWPVTYEVLTDAQAAEQLLLSGLMPPDDVVHHVSDKLAPPPIQPAVAGATNAKGTEERSEAEILRELDFFDLSTVKKFGPVRDDRTGDETTLFQYPNRWILFTAPSYQAAGKRSKSVTPVEATEWFLQNGLEVPKDLFLFLPVPADQQMADSRPAETSEQVDSYQEPPNGQKWGPVEDDELGCPATLTYYSPCYWILFGSDRPSDGVCIGDPYKWRKALTPSEATDWLLDNGFTVPPILTPYLPLPREGGTSQTEAPAVAQDRPGTKKVDKKSAALALLIQHPEWTGEQIANAVGVARTTLYDWPEFKKAKGLVKESGRKELSKGYKDSEGNLDAFG